MMHLFQDHLANEIRQIRKQIRFLSDRIKNYPAGKLDFSKRKNGKYQFYHLQNVEGGNSHERKYIKKEDQALAQSIAQRDYDSKLLKELKERLKVLEKTEAIYAATCPETVRDIFSAARQTLIKPLFLNDKEYVDDWMNKSYEGKPVFSNTPEIITAKGERVRSKSEKIIADTLYRHGISYKYEVPLELKEYGVVYPDFLVLNLRTRKEYYWEHFGMMDDLEYVLKAVQKIHAYEKNDILPGQELIITSETRSLTLSVVIMENIVRRFLL